MFGEKNDNIDTITNIFKIAFKKLLRQAGIILNGVYHTYESFFKESENEVNTVMQYASTTDVFGISRFPGIKRKAIYSAWPEINNYVAATLWKANEDGARDLKCKIAKARRYKDLWKPSAKTRMQTVIDEHHNLIRKYKEKNKGQRTK